MLFRNCFSKVMTRSDYCFVFGFDRVWWGNLKLLNLKVVFVCSEKHIHLGHVWQLWHLRFPLFASHFPRSSSPLLSQYDCS